MVVSYKCRYPPCPFRYNDDWKKSGLKGKLCCWTCTCLYTERSDLLSNAKRVSCTCKRGKAAGPEPEADPVAEPSGAKPPTGD